MYPTFVPTLSLSPSLSLSFHSHTHTPPSPVGLDYARFNQIRLVRSSSGSGIGDGEIRRARAGSGGRGSSRFVEGRGEKRGGKKKNPPQKIVGSCSLVPRPWCLSVLQDKSPAASPAAHVTSFVLRRDGPIRRSFDGRRNTERSMGWGNQPKPLSPSLPFPGLDHLGKFLSLSMAIGATGFLVRRYCSDRREELGKANDRERNRASRVVPRSRAILSRGECGPALLAFPLQCDWQQMWA
ncbi:hypothetical protein B0T25DRAFT_23928 [Lasiosphaeria hispida]|uniref:Uncharacterized protein n=1 Tax=Lasiosphaeria hispida TaxID=260671 RepID=A0AAJ0MJM3_9PEZI|nr:hypothetical protein B0T25DRAFT_23928 [Lasiosphaeria hispida]